MWEIKGVNSTFQNDTLVSCEAQRYASYTVLVVRELLYYHRFNFIIVPILLRLPSFGWEVWFIPLADVRGVCRYNCEIL